MGRTKGKHLHVLAGVLTEKQGERFNADYAHNKTALKEMKLMHAGKELNKLAGQVTNNFKKKNRTND